VTVVVLTVGDDDVIAELGVGFAASGGVGAAVGVWVGVSTGVSVGVPGVVPGEVPGEVSVGALDEAPEKPGSRNSIQASR
jgi:hypothetical protein